MSTGWRIAISLLVTALLVALLLWLVPLGTVLAATRSLSPWALAAGFALYVASYCLRTLRWMVLLGARGIRFHELLAVTAGHTLSNNFLPARTGEVSYIVLVRRYFAVSVEDGLATLLFARLLDMITLLSLFIPCSGVLLSDAQTRGRIVVLASVSLVVLLWVSLAPDRIVRLVLAPARRLSGGDGPLGRWSEKLARRVEEIGRSVEKIKHRGIIVAGMGLSLLNWLAKFLMFHVFVMAMGVDIHFFKVIMGAAVSELTTVLPVHGVAGLGTMEAGWTIGFVLLGLDKESAVATGFNAHVLYLLFSVVLGGIGLAYLGARKRGGGRGRVQ